MSNEIVILIALAGTGAMIWGGTTIIRSGGDRTKAMLMFGVAAVLIFNALILVWPV